MKKAENIVAIIPAKKEKISAPKKEKRIRPHWNKLVSVFFTFYEDKCGERPSFVNGDPRYLGIVIDTIEKKAIEKNKVWDESMAVRSLTLFFEYCFADKWLHENFLIFNMMRQMDRIFIKISNDINGKSNSDSQPKHFSNHKTAGQNIFADRLEGRLKKLK